MSNPFASLAPLSFKIQFSEPFRLIHSDLVADENYLKFAEIFALEALGNFLFGLKQYNSLFITAKKAPNPDEKKDALSALRAISILPDLLRNSRWEASCIIASESSDALRLIQAQWMPSLRRSLVTTSALEDIYQKEFLDVLQERAENAITELKRKRRRESNPTNKQVFEQFILKLEPFANGSFKMQEHNRLAEDALARLYISCDSKDPRWDDVLYHVGRKIERARVSLGNFLSAEIELEENPDEPKKKAQRQLTPEQKASKARKFLSKPHYQGMTPKSFSNLIRMTENYGTDQQKTNLYQLNLFKTNEGNLETINRFHNGHLIVIPKPFENWVPKRSFFPFLFQDVARRYHFFENKHWLMQVLKKGISAFITQDIGETHAAFIERCKVLQQFVTEELQEINQKSTGLKFWQKKSKTLFSQWKNCIEGIHSEITRVLEDSQEAIEILEDDESAEDLEEIQQDLAELLRENSDVKKEKGKLSFTPEEKEILGLCTNIFCTRSCETTDFDQINKILLAFRDAYSSKKESKTTSDFHKACRKESNEMFKYLAAHFETIAERIWLGYNNIELSELFRGIDLFAEVTQLIIMQPRKAFSEEQYHRFEALKERFFYNQLICLCKRVELLCDRDQFSSDMNKTYTDLLLAIQKHVDSQPNLSAIREDCQSLLEKMEDGISNRHIIQIRFSTVRELIEERIANPPPKISDLTAGIFQGRKYSGAQVLIIADQKQEGAECERRF